MPRGDGTGPNAMGSMTGRGAGRCTGGQNRNRTKNSTVKGAAGCGRCGWFNASELASHTPQENEDKLLKEQASTLINQLDEVSRRLNEL